MTSRHLRRTKLAAAFALTLLVGAGSFAATYRAMELMTPGAHGSVAPVTSGDGTTATVPITTTPAQPQP
jgi:hypothetical protein